VSTDTQADATTASDHDDSSIASFVDHRRAVIDLSNDLRTLQKHANTMGLAAAASEIEAVLQRVQTDKFNIVVVGEFNRGKSSLINALLGVHVAPTDVLACTAVLTRVTYSLDRRAVIDFKDGRKEIVAFDALPEYVTKFTEEAEARAAGISGATVYYPSPYCQNNVDVIDTPGLNEDAAMTQVTLSVLPEADAAIMVILAHAPFGEYERDFLESRLLTADLGRVIFVVNGMDRMNSQADAERVLAGIRKRISDNVMARAKRQWGEGSEEYKRYVIKIGTPRVFGLSAREAFEAKQTMDIERLNRSGFPQFEARLQNFLTEQRGAVMLQAPLNRVLTASRVLIEALALRESALALSEVDFEKAMAEAEKKVDHARQQWQLERARMEQTAHRVRQDAVDLGLGYVSALESAVKAGIEAMTIDAAQLTGARRKKTDREVERVVSLAISQTYDAYSIKLNERIEAILAQEVNHLQGIDSQLTALMGEMSDLFSDFETEDTSRGIGEKVILVAAPITGLVAGLGVWSGYRSAGLKGAAVGLGVSVGVLALVVATGAVTIPTLVVASIASYFGGGWAADALFKKSRIETYKARAVRAALKNLGRAMKPKNVGEQFGEAALRRFEVFKDSVRANAEAVLSDAKDHLNRTRIDYEGRKTHSQQNRESAKEVRTEVEAVLRRAAILSNKFAKRQAADDSATEAAA
jgi:predicted GTPase